MKYGWPTRSEKAVLRAVEVVNQQATYPEPPSLEEIERVCRDYASEVPATGKPDVVLSNDPEHVYACMMKVMQSGSINPQASPGWPLSSFGKEVSKVVDYIGLRKLCLIATARYLLLNAVPLKKMENLPVMERLALGICGFKRTFVKNEPHTQKKLAEGRERIIWNLDFVDQMIERALLSKQYNAEKAVYYTIPAVNGMSNSDEGIAVIASRIDKIKQPCTNDMEGYDNKTSWWVQREEAYRLSINMNLECYDNPVVKVFDNLNASVALTPGGNLFESDYTGGTRSGSLTTSQSGSAIRSLYSRHAFRDRCEGGITHGDDCAEPTRGFSNMEIERKYAELGLKVKEIQDETCLEFCGIKRVGNPEFLKPYKALTNFFQEVSKDKDPTERTVTLYYELRNSTVLPRVKALVETVLSRPQE